jgi:hypothetical protein
MNSKPSPLDGLRASAHAHLSGEFICATSAVEIHVFLQRGRIAWATDSSHPFEFGRYIKARCSIDDDSFRHVLEECRRDRLPLGETLVSWELASWDDVKAALSHQLGLALRTLADNTVASVMFLPRKKFADYDERLTFDLDQLLKSFPPPPQDLQGATSPCGDISSARHLLDAIRGAVWVELLEHGRTVDAASNTERRGVPRALVELTLGDDTSFVALRAADGCLIGARLAGTERQLWCMLSADLTFGAALAALSSLGVLQAQKRRDKLAIGGPIGWRKGTLPAACAEEMEQVFEFGRHVLSVGLWSSEQHTFAGLGRASVDPAQCEAIIARRAKVFDVAALRAQMPGELDALGFRFRSVVTDESSVWCFGTEALIGQPDTSLWVLLRRDAPQGLGWACLTALSRSLSRSWDGGQ